MRPLSARLQASSVIQCFKEYYLIYHEEKMKDKRCGPVMKAINSQVFTPMLVKTIVWPLTGLHLRHLKFKYHTLQMASTGLLPAIQAY